MDIACSIAFSIDKVEILNDPKNINTATMVDFDKDLRKIEQMGRVPIIFFEGAVVFPGMQFYVRVYNSRSKGSIQAVYQERKNDTSKKVKRLKAAIGSRSKLLRNRIGLLYMDSERLIGSSVGTTAKILKLEEKGDFLRVKLRGEQKFLLLKTELQGKVFYGKIQVVHEDTYRTKKDEVPVPPEFHRLSTFNSAAFRIRLATEAPEGDELRFYYNEEGWKGRWEIMKSRWFYRSCPISFSPNFWHPNKNADILSHKLAAIFYSVVGKDEYRQGFFRNEEKETN
ncbi:hypothetical protein Sjap_005915 [Stephania japonica]|uniref:Lon N-terminal domain-containing protein n=1 Tax=Stephania japonica TaxID=461633 RepID=A0AAP0K7D8_9MAGN